MFYNIIVLITVIFYHPVYDKVEDNMTDKDQPSHIPGYHIDPRDTLNNADVLKFLMNDTSTKIAELWKDVKNELDLDRKHNNEVNKQIVEGLGKRIETLEKYVISSLDNRSSPPTSEEKQPTFSCFLCVQSFHRLSSLDEHIESNHPSLLCVECGKTLRSKPDLYLHIHRDHKETLENTSQTSQTIVVCSPDRDPTTCNSFTDSQDNLNLPSMTAPHSLKACKVGKMYRGSLSNLLTNPSLYYPGYHATFAVKFSIVLMI